jgi:eukaryotic-like serine/threonine-protein kinase
LGERDDETEIDELTDATRREGAGTLRAKREEPKLPRGTPIGRYLVIDVLGEGGMGVVYRAFDPELDRKVAIKLLQARSGGSAGQAWLLREAQAMARLSHPNVIAVHDVGTLPGERVFVAMELVDGETLRSWWRERRPWRQVVPVMLGAGAGLAAAHAVGLVHRDFKPDNVLVGHDGRVRVMDFGLARLQVEEGAAEGGAVRDDLPLESASPLSAPLTVAGTVLGTPAYMAPELRTGTPAGPRTDQFAFGVALFEALFRKRPYKDVRQGVKATAPAGSVVPARVQKVVLRAIALDPAERFASMDELLAALAAAAAPKRRAVLFGGAALVAVAAAVTSAVMLRRSHARVCTGAEQRLAGAWDEPTRAAMKKAFEATHRPFAARAFTAVEHALDGYARDWTAAAGESCEATRVRGEQPEDVMLLRQACLDRRLDELRALSRVLVHADGELVEKGDKIVGGLEPVSRCADVAALRGVGQPPTEPRAVLDELHAQLADAKAQLLAGRYIPSSAAAKRAAELAHQVRYAPYEADALLVESAALAGNNTNDLAAQLAAESAHLALATHDDRGLTGAALSGAIMASQHALGEAKVWLGLAKAAGAKLHDSELELRTLEVEGYVAALAGDMAATIEAQNKALAAAERIYGPSSPRLWTDEEVIGVTFATHGAYDKAQPHLERALALRESTVGPDHPDVAALLAHLGACYSHAGQADRARAAYERALAIRERIEGANNPMFILTLNNMADGLIKAHDTGGALLYIDRAKALAEKLLGRANPLYHAVATTRAEALTAAARYDDARAAYDDVIALESKPGSLFLAATLHSRGAMELAAKQWAAAVTFEQRSIAAYEATSKDAPELWQPLTGLAQAYVELGRGAEAKPLLERAIKIGERAQISAGDLAPTQALLAKLK